MNTRILIIEDDPAIAQLHHRYLNQLDGFDVVGIATSQADARLQVEVLNPDLILLDVYLPDGTGLEFLQWIRGRNVHCDVILITAAREVETLQQAMRGGVVDYLLKPVMFPRLEAALKKYQLRQSELKQWADFDQNKVDKMFTPHATETLPQRLPKGIDAVTLDKIRVLFQNSAMLTADEAGDKIGASRTTARRYLEYLISAGELEADLTYGTVGRPERTYRRVLRHTS
ncbi:response regulator [Vibrio metoecus]|uniref:response regulator n=1 Tax=Vibrio metoecus TaxID=1481663 RepID=UPI0027297CDB|nr:response regulator [Vibrio metoecus]WKY94257.1 response regulator [Vibrio metoecus]